MKQTAPTNAIDETVEVAADTLFPATSFADVRLYADQVSILTVVDERFGEPEDTEATYTPRYVTIEITEEVWNGERFETVGVGLGERAEMLTWGRLEVGDERELRDVVSHGEPRLQVGQSYVAGLFDGADSLGLYPGTVALVDAEGRVQLSTAGELIQEVGSGRGDSVSLDWLKRAVIDRINRAVLDSITSAAIAETPGFYELTPEEKADIVGRAHTERLENETGPSTPGPNDDDRPHP